MTVPASPPGSTPAPAPTSGAGLAPAAGQAPSIPTPAVQSGPAPEPGPPAQDPRIAQLAKRERELQKLREDLRRDTEAIQADRTRISEWEKRRQNAKLDPLGYMEAGGITYEQVTEAQLAGGRAPATLQAAAARDEVQQLREELRAERAKQETQAQERAQQDEQALLTDLTAEVGDLVSQGGDDYELLNKFGASGLVVNQVWAHYKEHGRLPPLKQAAQKAEEQLLKDLQNGSTSKKFLAAQQAAAEAAKKAATPSKPQLSLTPQPIRTLTNELTSTSAPRPNASTEAERMQRAMEAAARVRAARAQ